MSKTKSTSKTVWIGLTVIALLVIALFVVADGKSDMQARVSAAEQEKLEAQRQSEKAIVDLAKEAEAKLEAQKVEAEKKQAELEAQLAEAQKPTETVEEEPEVVVVTPVVPTHVEDDLELGAFVPTITLSDVKLAKLFDTEVELDGDKYNVEESVTYSGFKVALDNEDYQGEAFLEVVENGVVYEVSFDQDLTLSDIGVDDENLEISFLGQPLTIKSWVGNQIVVTRGSEFAFNEGDSQDVDGKTVTVKFISDDGDVSISVDGETKVVSEGQSKNIGGLDVFVKEVLTNRRAGIVTLKVGTDVHETIQDGDEVEGFEDWTWVVDGTAKKIGVTMTESFEGFDVTEDYNALKYGESFTLPHGYVSATFTGLDSVDYSEVEMDLASKQGTDFVRVKGDFEKGLEKYDRVYVSLTNDSIYGVDADSNDLVLLGTKVLVRGTDFELAATSTSVTVVDKGTLLVRAEFLKDFSDSALDGQSLSGEEDHLSEIGIRVSNIEDASDDEVFKFSVPEEAVFATLTFQ